MLPLSSASNILNVNQNIDDPEKFLELEERRKIDFRPVNSE